MGLERDAIDIFLGTGLVARENFASEDELTGLAASLEQGKHEIISIVKDEEHGLYELVARASTQGRREFRINFELAQSVEIRQLRRLLPTVAPFMEPPLLVCQGDEETPLASKEELLVYLMEAGKKGLTIQRYKGLGEMNPDQLWETTMDPERRTVLEVRVESAAEADMLFSVLMGDAVEPRRQFIEQNALDVENLDV
jgi:DNA gyrase subunit B